MATEDGKICLEVHLHIHAPVLDFFDEAAWERTIKTQLENLVGFEVSNVRVIDVEARVKQLINFLSDDEVAPMVIEVVQLEGIMNGLGGLRE